MSRQLAWNRIKDLETLRGVIPHDAPILVMQDIDGFRVQHTDGDDIVRNARYQIAYTAIVAFLRGFRSKGLHADVSSNNPNYRAK